MQLDPDWSFDEALDRINAEHPPHGYAGARVRNSLIEAWGQLVGRTRALAAFDSAISEYGSMHSFGREFSIKPETLKRLRQSFRDLPDDRSRVGIYRGLVLGQWQLDGRLGSGGNAEVWRARNASRQVVAIKILKHPKGTALKRFTAEVRILETLGNVIGVLPLIDNGVDVVESTSYHWLALPVAEPVIRRSDSFDDTDEVIRGVRQIAESLVVLHDRRIYHRDIKPDNLYLWEGRWTISDFGIASFPGKDSLTVENRKLGPVYYIAPEMLSAPDKADGAKADVYSLAKTLWVLLTGQAYPLPGEIRVEIQAMRVGSWVSFRRSNEIDSLIEASTRHEPTARPSMQEFAQRLLDLQVE